jgi:ribosomal 50S subunit-associated protein YjgA (DUF615 family)
MPSGNAASPRRDTAEIRKEIAAERQRLDDDLTTLERDLLSSAPLVAGLLVAAVAAFFVKSRVGRKKPKPLRLTIKFD